MPRIFILTALFLVGCSTSDQPSAPITISFNPPDSTHFVVVLAMTRETTKGEEYNKDSTWTRTAHHLVARDGGFALSGQTDSITVHHNGSPMTDPLVQLFSRADITYLIDSAGRAFDVLGYEAVFAGLDTLVGPDTAASVRQMINAQSLKEQEISTWNQKFAPFVGRSLTLGVPEINTRLISLPIEGQVTMYELVEIIDTVRLNTKSGVHLRVAAATDPAQLALLTDGKLEDIVELFDLTDELLTLIAQRRAGSWSVRNWVIETETMLSHSETLQQEKYFSELAPSGIPVRNQMTETHAKTYTYPE